MEEHSIPGGRMGREQARWERCNITNSTEIVLITITNTFSKSTITKYRDVLITIVNSTNN